MTIDPADPPVRFLGWMSVHDSRRVSVATVSLNRSWLSWSERVTRETIDSIRLDDTP